jgi:hypothetical protein
LDKKNNHEEQEGLAVDEDGTEEEEELTEEQEKRKHMIKELDKYINDSKVWQTKKFAERTK